jgi:hypothetical protein
MVATKEQMRVFQVKGSKIKPVFTGGRKSFWVKSAVAPPKESVQTMNWTT